MSQITTCPSCGTRFRVVTDQLRISDGWVRCGQCQEVFDARQHLDVAAAAAVDAAPPVATPAVAARPAVAASGLERAAPQPVLATAAATPPSGLPAPAVTAAASATATAPSPLVAPAQVHAPAPAVRASPPPGYELPAPTLADDIDFSDYQPAAWQPHPSAADSAVTPAARSAEATPAPLAYGSAAPARVEPEWQAQPPAAKKNDFPALDLSILQVPAYVPPPAAHAGAALATAAAAVTADAGALAAPWSAPSVSSQKAFSSAPPLREKLSETEQVLPAMPSAAGLGGSSIAAEDAAAQRGTDGAEPAASASAAPTLDAIELAAQQLAQAEPAEGSPAAWASAPAVPLVPDVDVVEEDHGLDSSLEPGFVREARRKAWWQKPVVRVAMGAGVVVLPVALALQIGLHERNALAAWQPSVRPALDFMCTALQCKLGPRQHIASMVVSGSAFAKGERDRSYQLSLSIQNKASTPVGMPAVELTLTDTQDQAIARRVILAKDLGAPAELPAGAEWSGAVPVTTEGLNLQVSGYRVLLFYP